ncbi:uncharacterized protein E5676_scaffold1213G00270 [Cucumis melo var. makuwa]|uniref:Uncharacterized protein n=1 Tax=Cucumis melo var. makuwa TaxID=1194695 RepID=A0A5D3DW55_CUCMM|nr:uncharacterized protein E6C27_scaffold381G00340 [Cucumis melo var. makuwa]TYK27525.1 uncharacterized protein E5676_scaffold1213G00270 [Cucumis melo var. makuwa]
MSTSYSMWHVVLLPYNFPPWKCIKETNFFMSLLISDYRSSGKEIDVYLQQLIEQLKGLWNFEVHMHDTLTGEVQRSIRHVPYEWVIDHRSGYEMEYPSWDIDAIF